jgi:pyruvate,water dikinase
VKIHSPTTGEGLRDPLHEPVGPDTAWHTTNIAEAIPGVPTPLGWSFWFDGLELGLRRGAAALGILAADEVRIEAALDARACAIVCGRPAANIDYLRSVADRVPGSSGDKLERSFLGDVRPGVHSRRTRTRYASIALRASGEWLRIPARARRALAVTDAWWRAAIAAGPPPRDALRWFRDAQARFRAAQTLQAEIGLLCPPHFEAVAALARSAGMAGSELELTTRDGGVAELDELRALWELSRGRGRIDDFLAAHGYHAPDEGELSSLAWREDARPLESVLASYAALDEESSPLAALGRQSAARARAEAQLLARLPRARRALARGALAAARRFLPQRQVGKANFLRVIDVARAAARAHGWWLADSGLIEDAQDVFYLTADELSQPPRDARDLVAFRRARRAHYLSLELPEHWVGVPEPVKRESARNGAIEGIGVSRGVAEGVVRVALDLGSASDMEPGEILVCHHTDPGWASLLLVAAAFVVDVGGRLSHAAIVARELGTPCVVNARDATKRLRTGDRVRVDGSTGQVEILSRGAAAAR